MRLLEEYIKKYGNALNEDVLKVDAFLNHQIDAQLMMELAKDFKEHFKDKHITKIATIEWYRTRSHARLPAAGSRCLFQKGYLPDHEGRSVYLSDPFLYQKQGL
jgi:hypothetical protein